jgi:hypothetical protein
MWARAALAALCSLQINLGCFGVQNETPGITAIGIDGFPHCAKAHFVRRSQKILIGQEPIYPKVFCLRLDRGDVVSVQMNNIFYGGNRDSTVLYQQPSGREGEGRIDRLFWQNIMRLCGYSASDQFSSSSANIFEGNHWPYGVRRNPRDESHYAGTVHQIHSQQRDNWQFDANSCLGTEIGGLRSFPSGFSQANGEKTEDSREDCDYESRERRNLIPVSMDASSDEAYRRGAVFLGGLICFSCFAALYYWLLTRERWPAAGSADTELGVLMEPEVCHGATEVYTRVQA